MQPRDRKGHKPLRKIVVQRFVQHEPSAPHRPLDRGDRRGQVCVRRQLASFNPVLRRRAQRLSPRTDQTLEQQGSEHPFTPGTNTVGTIEAVGPGVWHLKPGQRVVFPPHYFVAGENVGDPEQILIGLSALGVGSAAVQTDWPDGTLAEYAVAPSRRTPPNSRC